MQTADALLATTQQFLVIFQSILIFILAGWQTKPQSQDIQMTHPRGFCFFSSSVMFHLKHKNAECNLRVKKGCE